MEKRFSTELISRWRTGGWLHAFNLRSKKKEKDGTMRPLPKGCERLFSNQLSESEIVDCEEQLGKSIPQSFRDFLMEYNGIWVTAGELTTAPLEYIDEQDQVCLGGIYGVRSGDPFDLVRSQTSYEFNQRVPANYLAIGALTGSAALVMDIESAEVLMWDAGMHYEDDGNVKTEKWLSLVAYSFDDYWRDLLRAE